MSNTNTNLQTQTSSVLQNHTVSSCSTSKVQEKTQLSRKNILSRLGFTRTSSYQRNNFSDCKTILTKLRTTFENAFNSEFKERMQKYTRFDAQSLYDAMICNMDSIGKYILEITLHQQRIPQLLKQKKLMQTQEHSNPISSMNVDFIE
ncbi:hypothetical protein Tco_1533583 [Tanacetum coccineum]